MCTVSVLLQPDCAGPWCRAAAAIAGLARVDDRRVGEADGDVEAAGAELLEVAGLVRLDERLVRLAAVERVGLQPFLAAPRCDRQPGRPESRKGPGTGWRSPPGRRAATASCRRTSNFGQVGIMPTMPSLRAVIGQASRPVIGSIIPGQRVGDRLIELVVGDLAGVVAEPAGLVEQLDLEAAEAGLVGREHVDAAAGIVLAVQRVVVLEDEHRDLRRRQRGLLQVDVGARSGPARVCAPPIAWPQLPALPVGRVVQNPVSNRSRL